MNRITGKKTLAVVLALVMCLASVSTAFAGVLEANGKYYSDFDSYGELLVHVGEVNLQTAEEGQVLLKNDGTLPLNGDEKVSVFGIASSSTIAGPSSNDAYWTYAGYSVSERGPIFDSLEAAGFAVNPTLADYYAALGFSQSDCGKESLDFSEEAAASIADYSDVAVIVLARYGGEGADLDMVTGEINDGMYGQSESLVEHDALYRGEYAASASSGRGGMMMMGSSSYDVAQTSANYDPEGAEYKHYLMLTDAEEALIDYAAEKCGKVVVVLNTSNAMEVYDLREDARINGILLMGRGGDTGHFAVGEILAGLVNPSGRLVDEWNTDFTADPTWNNFAWNSQTGSQNIYYNGEYGVTMTEYTGNGNYDDYLERGETATSYGSHNQNAYYGTDYEEDIYLGYAYWETLYASLYEALLENETVEYQGNGVKHTVTRAGIPGDTVEEQAAFAAQAWWSQNVTYAFGYGLSYTTFSLNIDADAITAYGGALESEDDTLVEGFSFATGMTAANLSSAEGQPAKVKTLVVPVEVTNTGDRAGKEVVELYVTAPYDAEDARLQKAFVTLAGFGKTDVLQPGESQTVQVTVNVQDFASFDYSDAYGEGVTGYTLDCGEYVLRAMSTSHYDFATDAADTADDYDEVRFTLEGERARLQLDDFSGKLSVALFSDSYDETDKVDGNVWAEDTDEDHYLVFNSLRTENLMADGQSAEKLLTRDTFLTYFPETPTEGDLTLSVSFVDHMDYWNQFSAADIESDDWYNDGAEAIAEGWKQDTGVVDETTGTYAIVLSDMAGKPLYDEDGTFTAEWNEFLNQLTVEQMTTLIRKNTNMWRSTGLPNIAKAANQQKDSYNNNGDTLQWVDAPTITATWNRDLAWEIGRVRGNLSLYNGWSAWGGPEMDTHRSPFSGRNYEYMSQDGYVGGAIASQLTGGMESMGVTCYIKHFAFNDQETCRDGMENTVWVSEQAARQIYLKVFQMCMQEGGSSSSMTGFARFATMPTSSNNRLMEGLVVDEWGWDGFFITDGYSGFSRSTTMASMMKSFVVPLPLQGRIPDISGRYDEETGKFYAYTGAWDTEYDFYGDNFATTTQMMNDRGTVADEEVKGGYRGEEVESYTQWYYMRSLAARILYKEANALTNLNGHSATTLPAFTAQERTFVSGQPAELVFSLSGEAASCFDENGNPNYTVVYTIDGDIPEGMTFDADTATLSGTPAVNGEYKITVSVLIDGWVSGDLVNDDSASINPNLKVTYRLLVNDDGVPTPEMDEELEENLDRINGKSSGGGMGGGGMAGFDIEPETITFAEGADGFTWAIGEHQLLQTTATLAETQEGDQYTYDLAMGDSNAPFSVDMAAHLKTDGTVLLHVGAGGPIMGAEVEGTWTAADGQITVTWNE
ncbi:MAG: glycoside hydrolase family 3 C-terminal domain-containing protein [Aristaeellaceae bacterium]